MKRSRPYLQPSRMHWQSGCRKWAIMVSLLDLTFSKQWHKSLRYKTQNGQGTPHVQILGRAGCQAFSTPPKVSSKFGSNLDRQCALAGSPGPIIDFFHKLVLKEYNFLPENIYNMDEKGFTLGVSNRSKFVCKAGRCPPRVTQDGTRELITAIETVSATQFILPPMVIYKGAGHYRGWYTELGEAEGEHGMVLVSILSTPMRSLPSSPDISEVHHYPPLPLNLSSSSKHHTTAETSATRPSTPLLLSAQIQHLLPILPLHSYVALPTRVKLP